ncbi:MAG TPA: iron dependent repressor, metal binding and dimerization domain protein [Vicinamibacterales bacterium]|nr:iron dependent repressor, metal binding and dimerization domain protein [Vicinamibacterales bacterium]
MTLLLWLALFALALAALAAPRVGLLARWRRHRAALAREQAENALKHLLSQAAAGHAASLSSLQGVLRVDDRRLLALTERLEREGLIRTDGTQFRLTAAGERAALHVVRAHRLWELYLADELGVPVGQVHAKAERVEHQLSPADLNRLSAAMGHPATDPHGDPIPTPDGEMAGVPGTPLSAWPPGTPARIVHLEDEPPLAYAQLTALGLHLGQTVRIIDASPTRLVLSDGENESVLAPMLAGNVHVEAAEPAAGFLAPVLRLSELPPDRHGEVVALDPACRGYMRRRLLDLGFTPGARVRPDLTTFSGDPRAYRIRGTTIALRREQSERILVKAVA